MKIIELQYLPQIQYIALLMEEADLVIDRNEHFVKQTYRNRCKILSANGVDALTVPVIGAKKKIFVKDIEIDYSQKWFHQHQRAIQSAYGRAPFYEYYADELWKIYNRNHKYLFDLSSELLTQCLDFLQLDIQPKFSDTYYNLKNTPENDFRSKITPKANLKVRDTYNQQNYQQVFGNNFVDNLSVIDLIFCEGPQAKKLIKSGLNG